MTTIESDKVEVNNSMAGTFEFLSDFNNYEGLMPDQITGWESTEDECSFNIKGMASIGMRIDEKVDGQEIRIKSTNKSPFLFDLNCFLQGEGDACTAHMVFESDLNPMLQMMVEKPLGGLFNHIMRQLKVKFDNA
ncbi:MAG: hypothetical protein JKY52_11220 [Flavobacteriales bacterium]|nr:hypothetical protein [Flavobacteriales bacterium]